MHLCERMASAEMVMGHLETFQGFFFSRYGGPVISLERKNRYDHPQLPELTCADAGSVSNKYSAYLTLQQTTSVCSSKMCGCWQQPASSRCSGPAVACPSSAAASPWVSVFAFLATG